jgi:hypothetical protein
MVSFLLPFEIVVESLFLAYDSFVNFDSHFIKLA